MKVGATFRCPEIERVEQDVTRAGIDLVRRTHQIDHYYLVGESNADGSRYYLRLRENTATDKGSLEY